MNVHHLNKEYEKKIDEFLSFFH